MKEAENKTSMLTQKPFSEKKKEREIFSKTSKFIKIPLKFLLKILASGVKTVSSFLLIILFFYFLQGFISTAGTSKFQEVHITGEGDNKIIVVPLEGIILNTPQPFTGFSGNITPRSIRDVFKHAKEDENIKGVILDIESPGGSAVASDRIFDIIKNFKKETKKPVVALFGDTTASGGYYIASTADTIIANPSTITGSIGVIATTLNVEELLDKLGIKARVFKKGEYKDIFSSTRETTEEEKEIIESILDDAYQQFIDRIVEGRNMPRTKVEKIATGKIFSGVQAKDEGLIDALGNLDTSIREVKRLANIDTAQIVRLETGDLFGQLFTGLSLSWLRNLFTQNNSPRVWYLMQ